MNISGKLVQVARPTPENSLARRMVGTAWSLRVMGDDLPNNPNISDFYLLRGAITKRFRRVKILKGILMI